jgi:hypothetical protein
MNWNRINLNNMPPEGDILIIHFKEGLKPCCGYTKKKKSLFTKKTRIAWIKDDGGELNEKLIAYWCLYKPPM